MQNTMISRRALKYCPSIPFTGRMCDIWGAYYLQAKTGYRVVYGPATVTHKQHRSWESIVNDMYEEMPGYQNNEIVDLMLENHSDVVLREIAGNQAADFVQAYQESFK